MSHGSDALAVARMQFDMEGLPFPELPAPLIDGLRWVTESIYATRLDRPTPYDLARYLDEVGTGEIPDYVLVGRDGRGINSHAMHYYCVHGPLALFLQLGWGGIYMDSAVRAQAIAQTFAAAAELQAAAEEARASGRLAPGERLVVAQSDFYGGRWRRLEGPESLREFANPERWHEAEDALAAALEAITASPSA